MAENRAKRGFVSPNDINVIIDIVSTLTTGLVQVLLRNLLNIDTKIFHPAHQGPKHRLFFIVLKDDVTNN